MFLFSLKLRSLDTLVIDIDFLGGLSKAMASGGVESLAVDAKQENMVLVEVKK